MQESAQDCTPGRRRALLVREREAEPSAAVLFAALEIVRHAREEHGAPPPGACAHRGRPKEDR
jgi:hypothetical protein